MDSSNESKQKFKDCMNGLCEYYGKEPFSRMTLSIYFDSLSAFSFDEITYAISRHIQNQESGTFMPKVADLLRFLNPTKPTTSEIIALARLKSCPLGVIAAMHIDKLALSTLKHNDLIDLANEVLVKFDEYAKMATTGCYTDSLLLRMDALGVSPFDPFMPGMPTPQGDVRSTIEARFRIAKCDHVKRIGNMTEHDSEEQEKIRASLTSEQMVENKKRVVSMIRNIFSEDESVKGDI